MNWSNLKQHCLFNGQVIGHEASKKLHSVCEMIDQSALGPIV
jgi:hypothetical protein